MNFESILIVGGFFAFLFIVVQLYYIVQLRKLERKFIKYMMKAIEKLEWGNGNE